MKSSISVMAATILLGWTSLTSTTVGSEKKEADVVQVQSIKLSAPQGALTGESIDWSVQSSGGIHSTSTNYEQWGSLGQTAVDESSSDNYIVRHGFWQDFGGLSCAPGDADGSGGVDIDDVVYEIAYIFQGGPAPIPAVCCGDADGSGGLDIDDVVYLIAYIFNGGPSPVDSC